MAIRCLICDRCVEPKGIDYGNNQGLCGFCYSEIELGEDMSSDTRECFDGSMCDREDQNCNKCKWMGKSNMREATK
jgi:hypothetical protein